MVRQYRKTVRPRIQTCDAFALILGGLNELGSFPEHERCFSEQPATQVHDARGIGFSSKANCGHLSVGQCENDRTNNILGAAASCCCGSVWSSQTEGLPVAGIRETSWPRQLSHCEVKNRCESCLGHEV